MYRILSTAEIAKTSRISKKTFSLKSFITLKPLWPPQTSAKSPEPIDLESKMTTPVLLSLPPTPELPSEIQRLKAQAKPKYILEFPTIRPGIKITYEEASEEPMDIESYYAVEKVR